MKAYSLHIGLNSIDPNKYGVDGKLKACEADANAYEAISKSQAYDSVSKLLTKEATAEAVLKKFDEFAGIADSGDLVVITYAGHGSQITDFNDDEADGYDETWVLYDRQLVDDEIFAKICAFKAGVRVLFVSDSCHSGTVVRAIFPPPSVTKVEATRARYLNTMQRDGEFEKNKDFYKSISSKDNPNMDDAIASIILMSGCQDNQFSMEGNNHGKFTETFLKVWDNGAFSGNSYEDFYTVIRSEMPLTQVPNFITHNEDNVDWITPLAK